MNYVRFFLNGIIISTLLCLFSINTFAQGKGTLRGVVTDSLSGEALPYSNIIVLGTNHGASADLKGNFLIPGIPAGNNYKVRISYLGYNNKTLDVVIRANSITQITARLSPAGVQLQEVEKIGQKIVRPNETDLGLQKMTIREIELLPKGVETDVFRSLQTLPGVQTTGDVSARYYVRGGGSDQNLVLLNGISVYNPFHALGLFSIIDPEMINAVEFYKGGFTAEYGGRLSSVLNLVTKDGNRFKYGGNANLSFLTGKAALEGPIPGGSFIVTGRKSLFKDILKKFTNFKDAPFEFYDASFKLNYNSDSKTSLTKLSLNGFVSQDKLINDDPTKADYLWENNIFGAYWFQAWEDVPIYSETYLSLSKFHGRISPKLSNSKERRNTVKDVTLRTDFTNIYESRDELSVGYKLKSVSTSLDFENLQGTRTALGDEGLEFSFYGKYKFMRFEDLGIDIGTRVNAIPLTSERPPLFEPRINLTYNLLAGMALKAAWGIYSQQMITLTNENEIISLFEPWLIVPDYLQVPEAIHYVAGLDFKRIENIEISNEIYYKKLLHTAEINDKKADNRDPDFVEGSGESYGWELMLEYKRPFMRATASYSLSYTYRNINGWISYPKYDTRHAVNCNLIFQLGKGWEASATWIFHSGLPFTQIEGFYDKLYFDDLFNSGIIYGYYQPYTILADKNLGRLPTYHRLDLNVTKKFKLFMTDVSLSVSVLNVYDRKNIFYFERDTGKRVNMLPILPTATLRIEI